MARSYQQIVEELQAQAVEVRPAGDVTVDGDTASARLEVTWRLAGEARWRYATPVELARQDGTWAVRWSPALVHPKLRQGYRLEAERRQPERASILDRGGEPLVTQRPVVRVGVVPGKAPEPGSVAGSLRDLLDIEAEGLEQRIRETPDDQFLQVITLRESDFGPLEGDLRALPGVAWREDTLPLAPTTEFARALLGRAGPVTAEIIENSGGRYQAGDLAGLSGMQQRYDPRLAGTPGLRVVAAPTGQDGSEPSVLFTSEPQPGQPVRTTLDPAVQRAADTALSPVDVESALVAVHVPSGEVLAVANAPEPGGFNRALRGQFPPGSTFKTVSTLALLRQGLSAGETVPCPEQVSVDGKAFRNYEGFALGRVPFRTDFARSCNTAFVSLASRLDGRALVESAATLGLGRPYALGVPAYPGEVPRPSSRVDVAATVLGQGRVLVSPLAMATVAGTIARGEYAPPRLVTEPQPGGGQGTASPGPPASGAASSAPELEQQRAGTIRQLMRRVVTGGSGEAVADVPGGPVAAKTGTAEYGTQDPPKTHAWMIGFQEEVAFAVFVQDGESGGQVAGPIAARFLGALH